MRGHHMLVCLLAVGVVIGLVVLDLPASTVLLALVVLACPLMMVVMMRGMHGELPEERSGRHDDRPAGPGAG